METKRRANMAMTQAKQLWLWIVALVISYADLVTTVIVGLEYFRVGAKSAAHVTFGMAGVSLGIQTLVTHQTGNG